MSISDGLTEQVIPGAMSNQDITINITCYESDGSTLRDMTTGGWNLTFTVSSGDTVITKTSAGGGISIGSPDSNSVSIALSNTEVASLNTDYLVKWQLSGTDTLGDNEFVAAIGTWEIDTWL